MSVLAAMARRAQALAAPRAAAYAAGNRLFTVTVRRPGVEPSYSRATHQLRVPEPELVYEGPARVAGLNPAGVTEETGAPTYLADTRISIGPDVAADPRVDDLVTVVDDAMSRQANVADRLFRVVGVARGGYLTVGFVLSVTSVEPSRATR